MERVLKTYNGIFDGTGIYKAQKLRVAANMIKNPPIYEGEM